MRGTVSGCFQAQALNTRKSNLGSIHQMPPLPKKKHTRSRKGGRAAHHAISLPSLMRCPRCRLRVPPGRACPECGHYKGRTVKGDWPLANDFAQSDTAA